MRNEVCKNATYVFVNEHNGNQKKRIFQIALVFTRLVEHSRTSARRGDGGRICELLLIMF